MGPHRACHIREQLTRQLLPPKPRARIPRLDLGQEISSQIGTVRLGLGMGLHRGRPRQQLFERIGIARRCRDTGLRRIPQPQAKLDHIPRIRRLAPLGKLIHPDCIKLGPSQRFAVLRGKHLCGGPIRPLQHSTPRNPLWAHCIGRNRNNPALAKHHHLSCLFIGLGNQAHTTLCTLLYAIADPFCASAGFARAAPTKDNPRSPVTCRRHLMRHRPKTEHIRQCGQSLIIKTFQKRFLLQSRRGCDQVCPRCQNGFFPDRFQRCLRWNGIFQEMPPAPSEQQNARTEAR